MDSTTIARAIVANFDKFDIIAKEKGKKEKDALILIKNHEVTSFDDVYNQIEDSIHLLEDNNTISVIPIKMQGTSPRRHPEYKLTKHVSPQNYQQQQPGGFGNLTPPSMMQDMMVEHLKSINGSLENQLITITRQRDDYKKDVDDLTREKWKTELDIDRLKRDLDDEKEKRQEDNEKKGGLNGLMESPILVEVASRLMGIPQVSNPTYDQPQDVGSLPQPENAPQISSIPDPEKSDKEKAIDAISEILQTFPDEAINKLGMLVQIVQNNPMAIDKALEPFKSKN